jgi:hypothetical protein
LANLQQLQEKLEKGFYLDNLYEMARLCKTLASNTIYLVEFFVMRDIFLDIARRWEERALPVKEAKRVELEMTKPLGDLIQGIETEASAEVVLDLLNNVVSAYLVSFE